LLWEVEKDDASAALTAVAEGKESWGLLFWIPLRTGGDQEGNISRWMELVNAKVASPWMRENLAGIALLFAELAGRFLVWERALEGLKVGESQVANRWRAQGELTRSREALLELLRSRFPEAVSAEVVQLIEQQQDLSLLKSWFSTALRVSSFAQFVEALK
jgi:hypothetical protein